MRYSNFNTIHSDAYVSTGLSEAVAFSLSGEYTHQGSGWGTNLTTGNDTYKLDQQYGVRGKVLAEIGADTSVTVIGDYLDRFQHANSFQPYPGTAPGLLGRSLSPAGGAPIVGFGPLTSVYDTYAGSDSTLGFHGGGASITVNHQFDFAKFNSISSYRNGVGSFAFDNSGVSPSLSFNKSLDQPSVSYTQEVQLVSARSSPISWTVGAFYYHYRNGVNNYTRLRVFPLSAAGLTRTDASEKTESVASFAQVDWEFIAKTKLTAGARYTFEKRNIAGAFAPAYNGVTIGPDTPRNSLSIKRPTFRAALTHQLTPDVLAYASFNTGFKSGGFNILSPTAPGYLPEKLTAYEVGTKTELFDHHLRFNASGFYYQYRNIQVNQITAAGQIVVNGAGTHIYGLDVDVEARLLEGLRFSGGLELLHARFTEYPNAIKNIAFPALGALVGTGDAKGNRLPLSQKLSGSASIDYDRQTSLGGLHFDVTANYNGSYYFEADNYLRQGGYTLLNASVRLDLPSSRLSFTLWTKNLLDVKVITQTNSQSLIGFPTAYGSPPLTYGITAQLKL